MYIRRYIYTIVRHDKYFIHNTHRPKTAPYIVYRPVPHHPPVLCITTADNTFYELLINFDNLAQPLDTTATTATTATTPASQK